MWAIKITQTGVKDLNIWQDEFNNGNTTDPTGYYSLLDFIKWPGVYVPYRKLTMETILRCGATQYEEYYRNAQSIDWDKDIVLKLFRAKAIHVVLGKVIEEWPIVDCNGNVMKGVF